MKTIPHILSILIMAFLLANYNNASADDFLENLTNQTKHCKSLVWSGSGKMIHTYTRIDTTSKFYQQQLAECRKKDDCLMIHNLSTKLSFSFKGSLLYCEKKETLFRRKGNNTIPYHINRQYSYDGEKSSMIYCDTGNDEGELLIFGTIHKNINERVASIIELYSPFYNSCSILGMSAYQFLTGGKNGTSISNVEVRQNNTDQDCYIVHAFIEPDQKEITVWLSKRYCYWPVKIIISTSSERIAVNNTYQICQGCPFPRQRTTDKYYFDPKTNEYIHSERSVLDINRDYSVNVDIDNTVFSLHFPPGMKVYDWRLRRKVAINSDISATDTTE